MFIFPVTRGCVVTCRGYKHTSVTLYRVLALSLSLSVPRGEGETTVHVETEYK